MTKRAWGTEGPAQSGAAEQPTILRGLRFFNPKLLRPLRCYLAHLLARNPDGRTDPADRMACFVVAHSLGGSARRGGVVSSRWLIFMLSGQAEFSEQFRLFSSILGG